MVNNKRFLDVKRKKKNKNEEGEERDEVSSWYQIEKKVGEVSCSFVYKNR